MTSSDSSYIVFTESTTDHSKVFIISEFTDYSSARRCAKAHGAIIKFADQFYARFTATCPNKMNGILA